MWEATSDFPEVDAVFASVVMLIDNFQSYNEVVETNSQVHLGEGRNSDVTDRRKCVEYCDPFSVFKTSVRNFLSWLEFLFFLILGIMTSFSKLERAKDSQNLTVKPIYRNQQYRL